MGDDSADGIDLDDLDVCTECPGERCDTLPDRPVADDADTAAREVDTGERLEGVPESLTHTSAVLDGTLESAVVDVDHREGERAGPSDAIDAALGDLDRTEQRLRLLWTMLDERADEIRSDIRDQARAVIEDLEMGVLTAAGGVH